MSLLTAVIIATRGRPQEVSRLLDALARQTARPSHIIVSACDQHDIDPRRVLANNEQIMFGSPGLTAQRNRALAVIRDKCDCVVFFDDDFIPSRFWIERIQLLFAEHTDVGTVTGRLLADGVKSGGLPYPAGQSMVDAADSAADMAGPGNYEMQPNSPYGCNMAFRREVIDGMNFDERLVHSGWLEDLDFGLRAGARAGMISTNLVWGVHLGVVGARASGLRFGYSQVVNPWYLMKKGIIKPLNALHRISRGTAGNALLFASKSHIDRRGRLKGNVFAIRDILAGKWAPEKVAEL